VDVLKMKCPECGAKMTAHMTITLEELFDYLKEEITTGKITPPDSDNYSCMECGYGIKNEEEL